MRALPSTTMAFGSGIAAKKDFNFGNTSAVQGGLSSL